MYNLYLYFYVTFCKKYFVKDNSKRTCILIVTGFDKFSVSSISKICSNLSRRESSFHGSKVKM